MPTTILHDIEQSFESATSGWYAAVFPFASSLFFALVAIELTWAAIRWTLERDDGVSILISLFRHIVAVSFFWALLLHAPEWMGAVVDSFQLIGARVSGLPTLNPSTVLDQGFAVCGGIFTSLATTGFFSAPMAHIIAIVAVLMVIISPQCFLSTSSPQSLAAVPQRLAQEMTQSGQQAFAQQQP